MFIYSENYEFMKEDLQKELLLLTEKGYIVTTTKTTIINNLGIDKITIKRQDNATNRLIFSTGLHGIEGYVGHACLKTFFKDLLPTLSSNTEVIIYHGINPFGMKNFRRTNENNIDLNRNFTKNNFQNTNEGYNLLKAFFTPKKYHHKVTANLGFYTTLISLVKKHGVAALKDAILRGQKVLKDGLYYSGETIQPSTSYILEELNNLVFKDTNNVVWIDLHTGYGPRYQMSIVNSQYEKTSTSEMIKHLNYPLILGMNVEDFYEIDGDMLEKTYDIYHELNPACSLFATCFEFGTLGDSLLNTISSLKAMVFENSAYFQNQNQSFNKYALKLIKEQFLPSAEKWRVKAEQDFLQAMQGIISYQKL